MNNDITYQDEHVYTAKGLSGYVFNEKCKNCGHTMDEIYENYPHGACTADCIYWCSMCGTLLKWNDGYKIADDDWKMTVGE